MTYHIIYKTVNSKNGKYYYGVHSTDDLNDGYLGSGYVLKRAIAKYGRENFFREIIAFFNDRENALVYESKIVTSELVESDMCYNSAIGGGSPPSRKGKVSSTNKLKGDKRTEKQRESSKNHSIRMKNRRAKNRKKVTIFGKEFESTKEARDYFNLSISQYYFFTKSNLYFNNPEELKKYIWSERTRKILESKKMEYNGSNKSTKI